MANLTLYTGGNAAALVAGLEAVEAAAPQVAEAGGAPILKLGRDKGRWTYGADDTAVPEDSLWAVVPSTFAVGLIAWRGGKPEGEVMTSVGERPVDPSTLPPVQAKHGWEEQVGVALVCVDRAPDGMIGQAVIYKQNSKGGVEAIQRLRGAVLAAAKAGSPCVPVVRLKNSSYTHPEYGTVYKPVFDVVGWEAFDTFVEDFGADVAGVTLSVRRLPGREEKDVTPPARRAEAAPTVVEDIEPTPSRSRTVTDEIRAAAAADDEQPFEPNAEVPRRRRRA